MTVEAPAGLTSSEVAQRVSAGLINRLPTRSGRSHSQIIRANVFTPVNVLLLTLFVMVMTTGHIAQGLFGTLIVVNTAIGAVQELRAKRTLDKLAVVGEAHPRVLRDGEERTINRDEVVQDDLVILHPGDQVVVDGPIVTSDYLELDESMLTGEADPVSKSVGDEVLSGTHVVSGSGCYRAERIGTHSYAAQLTAQASRFSLVRSELRHGVNSIVKIIALIMVPVAALTIWVQFTQVGSTWDEAILRMTAALVPMIPEGLVLITSMAFAIGVIRLGRHNCLVQELPALEGLARVSVVCADKTGTLTENAMSLGDIVPLAELTPDAIRGILAQLAAADPAPNASMQAIARACPAPAAPWDVTARRPFHSSRKWSGVSFRGEGNWLLGAAEVLDSSRAALQAEEISSGGRRVMLLGRCEPLVDDDAAPEQATPVALVVLDQVIRPDAAETLSFFEQQGIDIKVISGDNATSVGAVVRELGLATGPAVDARQLPDNTDAFVDAVNEAAVFGRVSPDQKRQMVKALQQRGQTVAMTGDGVNDVLALKDADLGVAMGSGSPATRAVAQLVLLDDRFATLPYVMAEGRRIIGNVERVAKLFLTKTIYAVLLALLIGLLRLPTPFLPLHMTIVGWFTIGIPAFLLSLAPNRERARPGFVKRTLQLGIPCGAAVAAATLATYLVTRGLGEVTDRTAAQASTASLAALLITACWVLAVVARPWVLWRLGLVLFGYVFYTAVFLWSPAQQFLSLDTSNRGFMLAGILIGLAGAGIVEAIWWVSASLRQETPRIWPQRAAA